MRALRSFWIALGGFAATAVLTWSPEASAQSEPKAGARAPEATKPTRRGARKKPAAKPVKAPAATAAPDPADAASEAPPAAAARGESESTVRAAGEGATSAADAARAVVSEKASAEGVKTYQFGAIEVEGRLRSPQVIYFLRRVRAEFDAGALGHRSFLRELSDTRNDPAFR